MQPFFTKYHLVKKRLMKNYNILWLQLFLLLCIYGCSKNPVCKVQSGNRGIIEADYKFSPSYCYNISQKNFLVRNDSELHNIFALDSESVNCRSVILPEIDFNKHSLLGQYADVSGGGDFLKTATTNDKEKKIIYEVYPNSCGSTKELRMSYNLVLIPKVPDDYNVEFILKK
jgi:hypothetical protein